MRSKLAHLWTNGSVKKTKGNIKSGFYWKYFFKIAHLELEICFLSIDLSMNAMNWIIGQFVLSTLPKNKSFIFDVYTFVLNKYQWVQSYTANQVNVQSVTKIYIYLFFKFVFFADFSGTTWAIKELLTSICILVWRAFR